MHLSKVDLNLFVVFDTIYAEGGITRASRRLNLSQPAISHALGRMRLMFDDPLFIRHGRAMTPTPLARRMIEPIRQALQGLEVTLNKVDRFDPAAATKRFVIGMRDALSLRCSQPSCAMSPRRRRISTSTSSGQSAARTSSVNSPLARWISPSMSCSRCQRRSAASISALSG